MLEDAEVALEVAEAEVKVTARKQYTWLQSAPCYSVGEGW